MPYYEGYDPDMDVGEAIRLGLVVPIEGSSQPNGTDAICGADAGWREGAHMFGCARDQGHDGPHAMMLRWTMTWREIERVQREQESARARAREEAAEVAHRAAVANVEAMKAMQREMGDIGKTMKTMKKTMDAVNVTMRVDSRVQNGPRDLRRQDVGKIRGPKR
jgi:hypothetical protein